MQKSRYIDLMERTLSAYTTEHIDVYYQTVRRDGLKEHGFPRLTADIGILLAHGRRPDLKDRFIAMMDLCCQQIPRTRANNDFSVKEIVFCLQELEQSRVIDPARLQEWKNLLRTIDPYRCYSQYAVSPDTIVYNWAAFTMVSEYMRQTAGLADGYADFIDLQAYSQLRHLDENGMYRDPGDPMVYDMVTRGLFAVMLDQGYQGKYRREWQDALDASADLTLLMQSVTGEIPYGGRSNQFIHNEAHMAILLEYYAKRFAQLGDMAAAGKARGGVVRALENIDQWLSQKPITHVKNRFPTATRYGCEDYAYFDKYMITAASFLYAAYRICDDTIPAAPFDDCTGISWQSSAHFHKLILRAGGYFAEYDHQADPHYDCSGLGRLHRRGAPSELCISTPCPAAPNYELDIENPAQLAIVPGICADGEWLYGTAEDVRHVVKSHCAAGESAAAEVQCIFPGGVTTDSRFTLDRTGLQIEITGCGPLRCLLPVFRFNGSDHTVVTRQDRQLTVVFRGWCCRYTIEQGTIIELDRPAANRNGHYDTCAAENNGRLVIRIAIEKC